MTVELSMTVIRMTIFIAPQSPSVVMKLSRDVGFPVLFPNDLYVSQNEPFKPPRLCAISHTKILSHSMVLFGCRKTLRNRYWTLEDARLAQVVQGQSSSHVCEMGVLI